MSSPIAFRCASLSLLACFAATTAHAATFTRSYLVNNVLLPTSNAEANSYAIDVDGDNAADNNFGKVLAALTAQGFDFVGPMDTAVASGSNVHLVGLQSTDVFVKNDAAAQATWCIGVPTPTPPLFNGTERPACADTSGNFIAALTAGTFTSPAPASAPNPVALDFDMAIGSSNATLHVLNARLSFTTNAAGNISVGQINGSIPHDNILNSFAPALAAGCNAYIQSNPSSTNSTACKGLFDHGCSGFPNYAGDNQIEVCEVTENALVGTLLAPDVQVVDNGSLVAANSIGLRFTAIAYDRVFASGFEP